MNTFIETSLVSNAKLNKTELSKTSMSDECLGVVLAGGLSSRMGQDKTQLLRNTKSMQSMLAFSVETLSHSGMSNILISGDNYDVPDTVKMSGPVGGILSVLAKYPHVQSLLILPVDLPFMTAKALTDLRLKGELSQKATYFENHNIPLYLPNSSYLELFLTQAYTHTSNDPNRASHLNKGSLKKGPSIKALLNHVPHQAIPSHDPGILFNTNTPEQWQQAKQKLNF